MDAERLEILITKYIDSEITAAEQTELDAELNSNPESKLLFDELCQMHDLTAEAFLKEAEMCKPFEEIYSSAQKKLKPRNTKLRSWVRFTSGLAAGLFVGMMLRLQINIPVDANQNGYVINPNNRQVQPVTASAFGRYSTRPDTVQTSPLIRNVDVYQYTDKDGNKYLITGYRDNMVTPVVQSKSF